MRLSSTHFSQTLKIGLPLLGLLALAGPAAADFTVSFDNLSSEPTRNGAEALFYAAGGSQDQDGTPFVTVDGVGFDGFLGVVGDQFVGDDGLGTDFYAAPHSGHYAIFNSQGQSPISLVTDRALLGAYFGRNDYGDGSFGADSVTVNALHGSNVLASDSLNLTSTTLTYLDTSNFASLTGITGYQITRSVSNGSPGHYIADDFTFAGDAAPVPEASTTVSFGLLLVLGGLAVVTKRRKETHSL